MNMLSLVSHRKLGNDSGNGNTNTARYPRGSVSLRDSKRQTEGKTVPSLGRPRPLPPCAEERLKALAAAVSIQWQGKRLIAWQVPAGQLGRGS